MRHITAILILATLFSGCSLTPPTPPLPEGEYRPVNQAPQNKTPQQEKQP